MEWVGTYLYGEGGLLKGGGGGTAGGGGRTQEYRNRGEGEGNHYSDFLSSSPHNDFLPKREGEGKGREGKEGWREVVLLLPLPSVRRRCLLLLRPPPTASNSQLREWKGRSLFVVLSSLGLPLLLRSDEAFGFQGGL